MNRSLLLGAPLLLAPVLLALSACGGSDAATGNVATTADGNVVDTSIGTAGGATAEVASTDEFVVNAGLSDMYEIESSKLALTKAKSAAVKTYAQQMIDEHSATTAKLKSTLGPAGVTATPPAELDPRRAALIADLQKADADKFDTLYLDQQTQAHREALTLMQNYATSGENAQLKALAAETTPKIEMHLGMVEKLDKGGADDAKGDVTENTTG